MFSLLSEIFWDAFTKNLSDHYIPGPFITIDEQLVPFRGRCSFIQYLPSKPDKYGIKIFWAADAENNFPLVAEPYLGRPLGADRQVNLGRNVALRLSAPFFNSGRNVTTDNFFTDKELSDVLQNNGLTFVGTVRANKRFLPESFKSKRGLQLHASSFLFQDKTTIVNYQTKANKNVVVMSTMHHDRAVAPEAPKKKPDIVRFYNSTPSTEGGNFTGRTTNRLCRWQEKKTGISAETYQQANQAERAKTESRSLWLMQLEA